MTSNDTNPDRNSVKSLNRNLTSKINPKTIQMTYELIENRASHQLNLFFAGWGMDAKPFNKGYSNLWNYTEQSFDTAIVYDYRSISLPIERIEHYDEIRIIAWSMGVWAANQIELPNISSAIAINGTGTPVDDDRGIPKMIFEGTLNGLNEENLLAFYRRMCGSSSSLKMFLNHKPNRSMQSLHDELEAIGQQAYEKSPYPKKWTKAYIGEHDRIFPTKNQIQYWQDQETPIIRTNNSHLL